MQITNEKLINRSSQLLKQLYGDEASFRNGQYEAIESVFTYKRSLVVQRTGWGKSLVYFLSTKINRENGAGLTFVVSPLLVLMQNQYEAASKLNLNCCILNSETKDSRDLDVEKIKNNQYDLIFITPETLFSDCIQKEIGNFRIGLFVVDEAHCISDWGHDFRLEYGKLIRVINALPVQVPVLATTATANDRVIADLERQLGGDVYVSRGCLHRESLAIQVLFMKDKAERYAWILKHLYSLPKSGIIYCLTTRDCDHLAEFLLSYNIPVASYHSDLDKETCSKVERQFYNNEIKAIIATIKLGMGYDKDDIGFVIHFQRPANIVNYYQQIGRAGRKLNYAYIFLMSGREDDEIHDYFINTAFPTYEEAFSVVNLLENHDEMSANFILSKINMPYNRLQKTLMFLENDGVIYKEKGKYSRSPKEFVYNKEYYDKITSIRKREQANMINLIKTDICYSQFIINSLDDKTVIKCGKCSNCVEHELIPTNLSIEEKQKAAEHINSKTLPIVPRKKWAATSLTKMTNIEFQNEIGICLSKYGDVGFGELVKVCKTNNAAYPDMLVKRAFEVLKGIILEHKIKFLTYIPSLRNSLVADLAKKIADKCGINCIALIKKSSDNQQKGMQNSSYQCYNALISYTIEEPAPLEPIILIDDMVDSKWTMTVCGYLLREKGCTAVFPFALADSSQKDKDVDHE